MMFRAILWDCEGELIDSELLACKVAAGFYTPEVIRSTLRNTSLTSLGRAGRQSRMVPSPAGAHT